MNKESIDTSKMCSHLQKKLFEEDGVYHPLWIAMQVEPELTAIVRSRQLHVYRNGKKVLVLAYQTDGATLQQSISFHSRTYYNTRKLGGNQGGYSDT